MDIWSSIYKNGITQPGFNFLQCNIKLSKINEGKQMQRKLQRQIRKKIHIQTSIGKIESVPCVFKSIFPKNWLFNDNTMQILVPYIIGNTTKVIIVIETQLFACLPSYKINTLFINKPT
jgi:hypothetical protein